jgi:tetratricopeptide (TPR) repeat protein
LISRAGADALFSEAIGHIIENAGCRVVLEQWDFTNHSFMERMHAALSSGARVIALLSNEYLASKHCEAEWLNAIATDPLNSSARLIVLRVNECTPRGLLTALAYWDLVPIRDKPDLLREVVLTAIKPGRHKGEGTVAAQYWRTARTVLHPQIKPASSFTGRANELHEIGNALRSHDTTAATQPAIVYGLSGVGKSTLAREYAHQAQDAHAGAWWLNAARTKDGKSWEGVEKGLVDLGSIFIRGLDQVQDRAAAARQTLEFIANAGFAKTWLLVYDNVDDAGVLRQWAPVGNARVLVTSQIAAWGAGVAKVEVKEWAKPDAVSYLVKESGRSDLTVASAEAIATALGCLPLALSHAAAYLRENENATAESYLGAVAQHMREAPESAEYDRAILATFQEQVDQVEARAGGARAILSLAAFYAPDDIPEELFRQDFELYPPTLAHVIVNPLEREKAIGALNRFSLIDFSAETRTFSVHRLVQAAARDALAGDAPQWAHSALLAASAAFPEPDWDAWTAAERLVPHVRAVISEITDESQDLAMLLGTVGTYLLGRAALADIQPLYERRREIYERSAKADPGNTAWQYNLCNAHNSIGDVLVRQGKFPAALHSYQASVAIANQLGWEFGLAISYPKIGAVFVEQGNFMAALDSYQRSYAIFDRWAQEAPENVAYQRDLFNLHLKIGDVLVKQGNHAAALDSYRASLAIMDRLANADPGYTGWQRNLSISHDKIGDVLLVQGSLAAALESYQASLAIRHGLATLDPGSTDWQSDLSISHDKIGDVLRAQHDFPAALESYQISFTIRDQLAKADPRNFDWLWLLSVSHGKIGYLLLTEGNFAAARDSYQAEHAISDRLAKADPGNARWQRDLGLSQGRVGMAEARLGARDRALAAFHEGRDIIARLEAQAPENAALPGDLAWFDNQIGPLER